MRRIIRLTFVEPKPNNNMSNKTKPKPRKAPLSRVMWARFMDTPCPSFYAKKQSANDLPGYECVCVAVIPLDDVPALVERAAKAIYKDANCSDWTEQSKAVKDSARSLARTALTAAGIPCMKSTKQRRARK